MYNSDILKDWISCWIWVPCKDLNDATLMYKATKDTSLV